MRGYHEPFKWLETDDVSGLTDGEITIVTMAHLGNTYQDIADFYGIKLGTIKSRLSRARAKIIAARQVKIADDVEIAQL